MKHTKHIAAPVTDAVNETVAKFLNIASNIESPELSLAAAHYASHVNPKDGVDMAKALLVAVAAMPDVDASLVRDVAHALTDLCAHLEFTGEEASAQG